MFGEHTNTACSDFEGILHHHEGIGFHLQGNGVRSFKQRNNAIIFAIRKIPLDAENEGKNTITIQSMTIKLIVFNGDQETGIYSPHTSSKQRAREQIEEK